jgi:hypothetical protein
LNNDGELNVRRPKMSNDEKMQLKALKSNIARFLATLPPDQKSATPSIGDDPTDWKDAFEERAAIREFDELYWGAIFTQYAGESIDARCPSVWHRTWGYICFCI